MDDISVRVGNRIKQLRCSRGISQEELALASSLNRAFIGQLERGEKNATIKTIEKLCTALDVTLQEFFSFEIDEIDIQSNFLVKVSSMLGQLDDQDISYVLDIMQRIVEFKRL